MQIFFHRNPHPIRIVAQFDHTRVAVYNASGADAQTFDVIFAELATVGSDVLNDLRQSCFRGAWRGDRVLLEDAPFHGAHGESHLPALEIHTHGHAAGLELEACGGPSACRAFRAGLGNESATHQLGDDSRNGSLGKPSVPGDIHAREAFVPAQHFQNYGTIGPPNLTRA